MAVVTADVYDSRINDTGWILIETLDTADGGDTIDVDLTKYGVTGIDWIKAWRHTTNYSVIVSQAVTTAVTNGVLRITLSGSNNNDKRVIKVGLAN